MPVNVNIIMSSSSQPPTPYKSRLLNFLNRQYISINDQVKKKTYQLKLGLEWTVQALLYPIYILTQTGRMTAQRLKSVFKRESLESNNLENQEFHSLPDSDEPIKKVLIEIQKQNIEPSSPNINIQGFATNLNNDHLVLVNSENKIVDIFTVEQQKKLHLLMRGISADYWEQKRIIHLRNKAITKVFSPIIPKANHHILPIIFFWQLMAWVQKSSLAKSLNLFNESQMISSAELTPVSPQNYPEEKDNNNDNISSLILQNLDHTLANLEKGNLFNEPKIEVNNSVNISQDNNNFLKETETENVSIQVLIQLAIVHFFGESKKQTKIANNNPELLLTSNNINQENLPENELITQISDNVEPIVNNVKNSFDQILPIVVNARNSLIVKIYNIYQLNKEKKNNTEENLSLPNNIEYKNDPFQVQTIILAAIDYFFNQTETSLSSANQITNKLNNNNSKKLLSSNELELIIEESWLSWNDLYADNLEQNLSNIPPLNLQNEAIVNNNQLREVSVNSKDSQAKVSVTKNKKVTSNKKLHPQKKATKNKKNVVNSVNTNHSDSVKNTHKKQVEYKADWLEIEAIDLGYEKHFLQVILEWLDKIIVWLEELLIKVFQFLKKRSS